MRKSKEERYKVTKEYTNTLPGRLNKVRINASGSSKKRNQEFNLTIDDMHTIYNIQKGKCYWTGWDLEFETHSKRLLSLDRLDNSKGYTIDNVVMACWCVNKARSDMTSAEFRILCEAVINNKQ